MISRWAPAALVFGFYVLHQDWWLWREARPLFLGVLPVGLFYHACYTLAVPALMYLLIRRAWPSHLDGAAPDRRPGGGSAIEPAEPRVPIEGSRP
jgi:hypothetical protein